MDNAEKLFNEILDGTAFFVPKDDATLLFMLAYHGKTDNVREQLIAGADPNERSFIIPEDEIFYNPAVTIAIGQTSPQAAKLIMSKLFKNPELIPFPIVELIIRTMRNQKLSWMPEKGFDNLYFPITHRDVPTVRVLLDGGADPNGISLNGLFPLFLAAETGNLDNVKELVKYGAKVNMTTPRKTTALMNAADEGHYDIVRYLLDNGANKLMCNIDGMNAYDMAQNHGYSNVASLLI